MKTIKANLDKLEKSRNLKKTKIFGGGNINFENYTLFPIYGKRKSSEAVPMDIFEKIIIVGQCKHPKTKEISFASKGILAEKETILIFIPKSK